MRPPFQESTGLPCIDKETIRMLVSKEVDNSMCHRCKDPYQRVQCEGEAHGHKDYGRLKDDRKLEPRRNF